VKIVLAPAEIWYVSMSRFLIPLLVIPLATIAAGCGSGSGSGSQPIDSATNECELVFSEIAAKDFNEVSGPLSADQLVESQNMLEPIDSKEVMPSGDANQEWLAFKQQFLPGDEVYYLEHSTEQFNQSQHILVRNNCIVEMLVEPAQ
jgi:hypothetical protein